MNVSMYRFKFPLCQLFRKGVYVCLCGSIPLCRNEPFRLREMNRALCTEYGVPVKNPTIQALQNIKAPQDIFYIVHSVIPFCAAV